MQNESDIAVLCFCREKACHRLQYAHPCHWYFSCRSDMCLFRQYDCITKTGKRALESLNSQNLMSLKAQNVLINPMPSETHGTPNYFANPLSSNLLRNHSAQSLISSSYFGLPSKSGTGTDVMSIRDSRIPIAQRHIDSSSADTLDNYYPPKYVSRQPSNEDNSHLASNLLSRDLLTHMKNMSDLTPPLTPRAQMLLLQNIELNNKAHHHDQIDIFEIHLPNDTNVLQAMVRKLQKELITTQTFFESHNERYPLNERSTSQINPISTQFSSTSTTFSPIRITRPYNNISSENIALSDMSSHRFELPCPLLSTSSSFVPSQKPIVSNMNINRETSSGPPLRSRVDRLDFTSTLDSTDLATSLASTLRFR